MAYLKATDYKIIKKYEGYEIEAEIIEPSALEEQEEVL